MIQAPIDIRKALFAGTASALALAIAAPAIAQDNSLSSTAPQGSVTIDRASMTTVSTDFMAPPPHFQQPRGRMKRRL